MPPNLRVSTRRSILSGTIDTFRAGMNPAEFTEYAEVWPAMTAATLRSQTAKELAQMARQNGVAGWHSMRKEELINALVRLARNRALERLGARPVLRMGKRKDGPVVSDQGFWIIDAHFDGIDDPAALDRAICALPGVLDHGLFIGLATDVLVGEPSGAVRVLRKRESAKG